MKSFLLMNVILLSSYLQAEFSESFFPEKRSCLLYGPFLEWELKNPTYNGNPYDIIAKVIFTHSSSNEKRITEMFYDENNTWKFRFTGTKKGTWAFTTISDDPELNGFTGSIVVSRNPDKNAHGFITNCGNKWVWEGTNQPFSPQYLMYKTPDVFSIDENQVDKDINEFIVEHGFTGFHVPTIGMGWFDIHMTREGNIPIKDHKGYDAIDSDDPNPDPRTFNALEMLITKTYQAGGAVHIWMWGDQQRKLTPLRWGVNQKVDQRLQRYIAARLGPLPCWTMGYGFDLYEWINEEQLTSWHDYMHEHFGWHHYLGARSFHAQLTQISDALDYASYQQHRPDYNLYVKTILTRSDKPSFSEDRFRIRNVPRYKNKDYDTVQTRRGLWHSTMAGGVANIWGYLYDGITSYEYSLAYPNKDQIKTWSVFFHNKNRFRLNMAASKDITDGYALVDEDFKHFIFYIEDSKHISLDLSGMSSCQSAIAVDTKKKYREIQLGKLKPDFQKINLPYESDWAIAVGKFN